jgi:heme-degrading monooxygenase HmoA
MFAVIFEVQPRKQRRDAYLDLAARLKPELEKIDGFIDIERFAGVRAADWVLSLSAWRDEKAVIRWRTFGLHHEAQEAGRSEILADYHLRVGEITADTDVPQGQNLKEQRFDATEIGAAKAVTISELAPGEGIGPAGADLAAALALPPTGTDGVMAHEVFASIYNPGKLLLLASWRDAVAAGNWEPAETAGGSLRHRIVRIIRDYGMRDRREAPQYYQPVTFAAPRS